MINFCQLLTELAEDNSIVRSAERIAYIFSPCSMLYAVRSVGSNELGENIIFLNVGWNVYLSNK